MYVITKDIFWIWYMKSKQLFDVKDIKNKLPKISELASKDFYNSEIHKTRNYHNLNVYIVLTEDAYKHKD